MGERTATTATTNAVLCIILAQLCFLMIISYVLDLHRLVFIQCTETHQIYILIKFIELRRIFRANFKKKKLEIPKSTYINQKHQEA